MKTRKWAAALTLMAFVTTGSVPRVSQARVFDLREQEVYTQAFTTFVHSYEQSVPLYQKQGPLAFIEALWPHGSADEKAFLRKSLGSLPRLPKLSSDQALLILDASSSMAGIHTVEVSNIDDGMIIVDGSPVEFDVMKADLETIAKKIEGALDRTAVNMSWSDRLSDTLIPTAHAKPNALVYIALGIVGALGTRSLMNAWDNRQGAQSAGGSDKSKHDHSL